MQQSRIALVRLSELVENEPRTFLLDRSSQEQNDPHSIVPSCTLVRIGNTCFAVGSICPHQNATFDSAKIHNGCIVCRRHGFAFDLKTGDCTTLGGYGIPTFEVAIENDIVYVSI